MIPKCTPEDPNSVTRVLPPAEAPFLPGIYQGGPVGTIVLPLHPVHADSGVGDRPVRLLGRQVCSVQGLFEEFQFSHRDFAVFRYSALHVKHQLLACDCVRVEDFSCHTYADGDRKDGLSLPSCGAKRPHFMHNYHHNTLLPCSQSSPSGRDSH